MATYVNDLRLKEIATGDESGTWGTSTNTNLELIGNAMGVGAEAIANASTHTITMADGVADEFRSTFLRLTGGGQACTVTLAPNTLSHTWIMRNETSATLTLTQGSGANVAIAAGQTKIVATDGGGSGAIVYEMDDLELAGNLAVGGDLTIGDDLTITDDLNVGDDINLTSDSSLIKFGADGDTTLTHTDGSGLTLNSTNKIMFNDASQFIQGSSATVLSLGATDEIDLTATAIDVNGTMDVSGALTGTTATFTTADNLAALTVISTDADANVGPLINFQRDSGSPADSDTLGRLQFLGKNDASEDVTYASIDTIIQDASDGTEDAQVRFRSITAGTTANRMEFTGAETVFNESSKDLDFRVESDGNTHMLFVDAGNDRVGIGTSSPSAPLDIVSSATGGTTLELDNTSTGGRNYTLYSSGSGNSFGAGNFALYDADAAAVRLLVDSSGNVGIGTSSPTFAAGGGLQVQADSFSSVRVTETGNTGLDIAQASDAKGYVYLRDNADLLFGTNNTERMRIDSSGNLLVGGTTFDNGNFSSNANGINVFDATHPIVLVKETTSNNTFLMGVTSAAAFLAVQDAIYMAFFTSDAERMRIDASGNVGIGTTPAHKLHVADATTPEIIVEDTTNNVKAVLGADNSVGRIGTDTNHPVTFRTNDTERMRIDSSGNVGIGASSPSAGLHVLADVNPVIKLDRGSANNANANLYYNGTLTGQISAANADFQISAVGSSTPTSFYTNGAERMRIDSSGNVGIGSTVFSSARVNSTHLVVGTGTNSPGITLYSDLNSQGSLNFGDAASGTDSYDGGLVYAFGSGSPFLSFHVNGGTERMRIDSSGNLIVGNTSDSAASSVTLQNDGDIRGVLSSGAGGDTVISAISGVSNGYQISVTTGNAQTYKWFNGGTQSMTLDSSGNLSVGTTSALNGSRISFQGPASDNQQVLALYNPGTTAATTYIQSFATNTTYTERGYITWNGSTMSLSNASDIRLKENVLSAPSALPVIDSIKVKSFDFKEDGRHVDYGVIAQELYEVFPSAVSQGTDKEDGSIEKPWAVGLEPTIPLLIKAIQEQQALIESLTARITQLENN